MANQTSSQTVRRWTLVAVTLASGSVFLNGSVVNVALPVIDQELQAGFSGLQWVIDGYLLTLASLLIIGGALGDRYGRKRVMIIGLAGFAITLVMCGFAPSIGWLIAGRVLQGMAGALMLPGALALIRATFDDRQERGSAIGSWSGWSGIAAVIGPLLGGWLVTDLSWRWAFFVSLPLVFVTIWLMLRYVPESLAEREPAPLDWLGAAFITLGLAGIAYGLIEGPVIGWDSPTIIAALAAGGISIVVFPFIESQKANPMVPLEIFRSRNFSGANLTTLGVYAAMQAMTFLLVIYIQNIMGYSPLLSGMVLAPVSLLLLVFSPLVGRLAGRYGPRLFLTSGPLFCALGLALMASLQPESSLWIRVLPIVAVFGIGLTLTVAPLSNTIISSVSDRHYGVASAFNNMISRVAGLLAVAFLGVIMTASYSSAVRDRSEAASLPRDSAARLRAMSQDLTSGSNLRQISQPAQRVYRNAFTDSFGIAMLTSAAIAASGGVLAALTLRNESTAQSDQA